MMTASRILLAMTCSALSVLLLLEQIASDDEDCDGRPHFLPRNCSIRTYGPGTSLKCEGASLSEEVIWRLDTYGAEECFNSITSFAYSCSDSPQSGDLNKVHLHVFQNLNALRVSDCNFNNLYRATLALPNLGHLVICNGNEQHPAVSLVVERSSIRQLKLLQKLHLSGMKVGSFPAMELCGVNEELNISGSWLTDIESLNFGDATISGSRSSHDISCGENLTTLILSDNLFQTLPSRGFSNLKNLRSLSLKDNKVNRVHGEAFAGLTNLQNLSISGNRIENLTSINWKYTSRLVELDLNSNAISGTLNYVVFENLNHLLFLNLAFNRITCIDSLAKMSSLQRLHLGYNNVSHLKDGAFQNVSNLLQLLLPHNRISNISENTFSALKRLRILDLSQNSIAQVDFASFHFGLNLYQLDLSDNRLKTVPDLAYLSNLRKLHISNNEISVLAENCFENLSRLTYLSLGGNRLSRLPRPLFSRNPELNRIRLNDNELSEIDFSIFESNTVLEVVQLNNNLIENISEMRVLKQLKHLELQNNLLGEVFFGEIPFQLVYFNLSGNNISSLGIPYGFTYESKLAILDVSHNALTDIPVNMVTLSHLNMSHNRLTRVPLMRFDKNEVLEEVDLRRNHISHIGREAVRISDLADAKFYLEGNLLRCDCTTWWLAIPHSQNQQKIGEKYGRIADLDFLECSTRVIKDTKLEVMLVAQLPSQRFVCEFGDDDSSHFNDYVDHRHESDWCVAKCECYFNHDWSFVVTSCSSEKLLKVPRGMPSNSIHIYLDGNNIVRLDPSDFEQYPLAEKLYINDSHVEMIQEASFAKMLSLRALHLERNNLRHIGENTFEGLRNLSRLFLQGNLLRTIHPLSFLKAGSIAELHLHGNHLGSFPPFDLEATDSIAVVTFRQNRWECRCTDDEEVRHKVKVLNHFSAKIVDENSTSCYQQEGSDAVSERALPLFEFYSQMCDVDQPFPVLHLATAACATVAVIAAAILLFVYRLEMQVLVYSRYQFRLFRRFDEEADQRDKRFDAFVAYSNLDEDFVASELLPRLEGGERPFRLCVHHRDFLVGGFITNSILEAIDCSRRTIVVMSDNFSNSNWCRFEFKSAHVKMMEDRCPRLIMILLTDVPEDLDPEVKLYFKTNTYLRYGEKLFWEKLHFAMPARAVRSKCGHRHRATTSTNNIPSHELM